MAQPLKFKFKIVDNQGNDTGVFSTKGSFDGETLVLGEDQIPVDAIMKIMRRFNRLLVILPGEDDLIAYTLSITSGNIAKLHSSLNMIVSERQARAHLEELEKKDLAHEFRVETCPFCQSTLDMTRQPKSAQVYCGFCDAVATLGDNRPADEAKYRHCDQCDLYAQPKGFTVFYFYFLLVVYGWNYRKMHMCNTCMRSEAWKMFFGNLIFILGVPTAIIQLCRAYFGGSTFSQAFAGLDKANALFKKGRIDAAAQLYNDIAERLGASAGVRYNHGLALAAADRLEEAAIQFEYALNDCANYDHAVEALFSCYKKLGRDDDAENLRKLWSDDDLGIDDVPA